MKLCKRVRVECISVEDIVTLIAIVVMFLCMILHGLQNQIVIPKYP